MPRALPVQHQSPVRLPHRCPEGHALQTTLTCNRKRCGACGDTVPRATFLESCMACKFDLCGECDDFYSLADRDYQSFHEAVDAAWRCEMDAGIAWALRFSSHRRRAECSAQTPTASRRPVRLGGVDGRRQSQAAEAESKPNLVAAFFTPAPGPPPSERPPANDDTCSVSLAGCGTRRRPGRARRRRQRRAAAGVGQETAGGALERSGEGERTALPREIEEQEVEERVDTGGSVGHSRGRSGAQTVSELEQFTADHVFSSPAVVSSSGRPASSSFSLEGGLHWLLSQETPQWAWEPDAAQALQLAREAQARFDASPLARGFVD